MIRNLFFVILLIASSLESYATIPTESYRVALRYLPSRIDPRQNQINTNHFILLQLYYPMFSIDDSGSIKSEFFAIGPTRALDRSFTKYRLCLKRGIKFSDGSPIHIADVRLSLYEVHRTQETLAKIDSSHINGSCLYVHLTRTESSYFHRLVGVTSTVLKSKSLVQDFPIGLGPYRMARHSADKLVLKANNERIVGNIGHIEFIRMSSGDNTDSMDDVNHFYQRTTLTHSQPMKTIETPVLKSYALIVNLPTRKQRLAFASCVDSRLLQRQVRPELAKSPGFLPKGVFGADVSYKAVRDRLGPCSSTANPNIAFYAPFKEDVTPLERYFSQTSIEKKVSIVNVSPETFSKVVFDRAPKAVILGFDSSGSLGTNSRESSVFFESFIRDIRVISTPPEGLATLVVRASMAGNESEKSKFYREAHQLLLESGYVIPLGQAQNVQHYPVDIENIEWADRLSGFPRIYKMKRVRR